MLSRPNNRVLTAFVAVQVSFDLVSPNHIPLFEVGKFNDNELKAIFGPETKFPKKYVKVLDRLLSHSPDNATITMFTDKAGAGTLASTAGEIIGMIGLSIQDPTKRKAFFDKLRQRVKENGGKGIVDESWVNASEAH